MGCGTELKGNDGYCKECRDVDQPFAYKKARIMTTGERTWLKPAIFVAAIVVIGAAAGWLYMGSKTHDTMISSRTYAPLRDPAARTSKAIPVTAQAGEVRIPLKSLEDGNARFFGYTVEGKTITFFAIKATDGSIRTAFDACLACRHAKLGYRQEGKVLVCNNCGMAFSSENIGKYSGGCNPIPLERRIDNNMLVLKTKDIEAGSIYF